MPSTVEVNHVFNASWESATTAFWCKYPHPDLQHVKDALVLNRYVDSNGVLHTRRLIHMDQKVPSILQRFSGGVDSFFALEDSTVDPQKREMVLKTRNLTYGSLLDATEICTYSQSQDDSTKTEYSWSFTTECKRKVPFLTGKIESTLTNRAKSNSGKGLRTMDNLSEKFQSMNNDAIQDEILLKPRPTLGVCEKTSSSVPSQVSSSHSKASSGAFQFLRNKLSRSLF
mmetsp:Transcript_9369/g.10678  ORF Transcript_9369/g.10678 Transcript_9369/m.10678 type:complete len:228 (+) Transcript_9369:176-859(+)